MRSRVGPVCVVIVFALAGTLGLAGGRGEGQPAIAGRVELIDEEQDLRAFHRMDLDVDGVFDGWARVYLLQEELRKLRSMGYTVTALPDRAPIEAGLARQNPASGTGGAARGAVPAQYHTYDTLTADLQQIAIDHAGITELISIGQSVQGRELWMMKITANPSFQEIEPEVALISSMHGDEVTGKELCFNLIDYLTDNYGIDSRVTTLIDTTEIWILPSMNPDGTELGQRYNASGVDLNRDFPDQFVDPINTTAGRASETAALMTWRLDRSLSLSANMHGGALVANYPFDSTPQGASTHNPAPLPDHDVFYSIARTYADNNLPMSQSNSHPAFDNGVTNGADWYAISGGMQDWEYVWHGDFDLTLEVSNNKWPPSTQLPQFWTDNLESMLSYLERVHSGIRGVVTGSDTGLPLGATILVDPSPYPSYTDPDVGDYNRVLLPGSYTLTVDALGYAPATVGGVTVVDGPATQTDFALDPLPADLQPQSSRVEDGMSGNGQLDLGETADLAVTVMNLGRSATAIDAELIPTGWYGEVVRPEATYPDAATGASVESDAPYHGVALPAAVPAGHQIGFAVRWIAAEGAGLSEPFFLGVGSPLAGSVAATDTPQAIQSLLTAHSEITVTQEMAIGDIRIPVNITHTYIGDIEIVLTSPASTQVKLHDRGGGPTDDIVGTYGVDLTPVESLAKFNGENAVGTWSLDIYDAFQNDEGTLNDWSVEPTGYPVETATPEMRFREFSRDAGGMRAEWWPYPGLTSYHVYRSTDPSQAVAFVDVTGLDPDPTDTAFVDAGTETLVFYLVTGDGPSGEGAKGHFGE